MQNNTLKYSSPTHGDWGIVRIASLVPESYMLFVCPFACGRHGALGAIDQGFKDRLSYVYIDQTDIIEGYDQTVLDCAKQMLERLKKKPKAVFIYVSCLDDLIGTDLDALVEELNRRHEGVAFRAGHMNPITIDSIAPPALTTQDAMFSFLNVRGEAKNGVNLIGNLVAIDRACELYDVLQFHGAGMVRHMSDYDTFEHFQEMALSRANIVLSPIASLAAKNMQKKHGMPFGMLPISYDLEEISWQYDALAHFLQAKAHYDFAPAIAKTRTEIDKTVQALAGRGITVSSSAVIKPFGLAKALLQYGFNVEAVVAEEVLPIDKVAYEWLMAHTPDIKIIQPQNPDLIKFQDRSEQCIAIGFDAAYITGSRNIADLSGDQRLFGYWGVRELMRMISKAHEESSDLEALINAYGVVV